MLIRDVAAVLQPHGLLSPDLELLRPTEKTYRCLLLQPSGPVYADVDRIGPVDLATNHARSHAFLRLATERSAHLAVTPEYFYSWTALREAIEGGLRPPDDGIWVLGCESTREPELSAFAAAVAASCLVVHEPFAELAVDRALLDPVALVFQARTASGGKRLVCLVQFKTYPSRDDIFLEESLLRRGTTAYQFRGDAGGLTLTTMICSDAFSATSVVGSLVDRGTLIHVQLNPSPRNSAYRQYRKTAFEINPQMSECHVVCLNWARNIVQQGADGHTDDWKNIAGSAWYCPESACSYADPILLPNHEHGLYYTYMREDRRHALLLHYDEVVVELQVPKVVANVKAVMANKNGPSATHRYLWDAGHAGWLPAASPPDSGFTALLSTNPDARNALKDVTHASNVIEVERILALCEGAVVVNDAWHAPRHIDSFQISSDEVMNRVTVTQDPAAAAAAFRHTRLDAAAQLRNLLDTLPKWPAQVGSLSKDAKLQAHTTAKQFNLTDAAGRPALVAYLGDSPPPRKVENVSASLTDLLRRSGGGDQTRLCVVFRRFGGVHFARLPGLTRFDDALNDQTDILAADPEEGNSQ